MCGLVGFYTSTFASDDEVQMFKQLLLIDQIRGMHATGVAKVRTAANTVAIHKRANDAVDYLAAEDTKEFFSKDRGNIYIGHNRYATMGNKADHDNAHPFQEDHITLVHNGGVDHWGLDLLEGHDDPAVKVDSHMVCKTIAAHGIKKAVEEHLSGAFALVWWDSKERSLNFIRNTDRPLYLAVLTTGTLVWASEKGMLDVLFDRGGKASKYRLQPELLIVGRHYKFKFSEAGVREGNSPIVEDYRFLDLPVPAQVAAWFGENNSYYGSQTTSRTSQRSSAASYNVDKTARINRLLIDHGLTLREKTIVTADVVRFEPYPANPSFGRLFCVERLSNVEVEAWGINAASVRDVTVVRATIEDVYEVVRGGAKSLTITIGHVGISCFDDLYDQKKVKDITTMSTSTNMTSRGEVVELRPKKGPQGEPVRYPLKTCGHTFPSSQEFVDFVSQGCAGCGKIPTAYDRRNHKLTVYEGKAFQGLLKDCDFLCGECCEEEN